MLGFGFSLPQSDSMEQPNSQVSVQFCNDVCLITMVLLFQRCDWKLNRLMFLLVLTFLNNTVYIVGANKIIPLQM